MELINYKSAKTNLYNKISAIDFNQLAISNYNKEYIGRLKPALPFFLAIYANCLKEGLSRTEKDINEVILVDYGGGSGFLSMLAKEIGIGKVIYIDLNEKSVEAVELIQNETGIGPDIILHGESAKLAAWCSENNIKPDLLLATDVIEHIYDLSVFFKEVIGINNQMDLIFTTASTPYNPHVKNRLHRYMRGCETGKLEKPNYYTKRVNYIKKAFPKFSRKNVRKWAVLTRGLIYSDIHKAISQNEHPLLLDAYNTCDPETGNWTERILPMRDYRELVATYHYTVEVKKGFYNTQRPKLWKKTLSLLANQLIKHSGKVGLVFAPFIFLSFSRK